MTRLFQSEPVLLIAASVGAGMPLFIELLASFDVVFTPRQAAALTAVVAFLASIYTRSRVTPVRPT